MSGSYNEHSSSVLNSPNDSSIKTHQILIETKNQDFLLYLPCYFRVSLRRFRTLSIQDNTASIECYIRFDIDITNLPRQVVNKIKQNLKWNVNFEENPQFKFNDNLIEPHAESKVGDRVHLQYLILRIFTARSYVTVIWTPFEVARLILSFKIEDINLNDTKQVNNLVKELQSNSPNKAKLHINQPKSMKIMFNLMEYLYNVQRIDKNGRIVTDMAHIYYFNDSAIGQYQLAQRILEVQYTNKKSAKLVYDEGLDKEEGLEQSCLVKCFSCRSKSDKPQQNVTEEQEAQMLKRKEQVQIMPSFSYAHFTIPLFRRPLVSIFSLMVPGYILGLLSLAIFFLPTGPDNFGDRLGAIATVFLAEIALLPVIRTNIPSSPKLTIIQVVGYLEVLITVLCLFESFIGTVRADIYEFVWYTNPFFMISLIIQGFASLIFVSSQSFFYFYWLPQYQSKTGFRVELKPKQWGNKKCNQQFTKYVNEDRRKIQYY